MATEKQREAARRNIRKAQAAKKAISDGQHARAQPEEGRKRKKPGTGGEGDYYHVELSPKGDYMTFRTQDVGARGTFSASRASGRTARGTPSSG